MTQDEAFEIRNKTSADMIHMASAKKSSRGKTYYCVDNSETRKALREFRQTQLNQNKNNTKKDDKI